MLTLDAVDENPITLDRGGGGEIGFCKVYRLLCKVMGA
jgi:hypothetical protein